MRGDAPHEASRIAHLAVAIAPKLVLERENDLAAVSQRLAPGGIGVRHVEAETQRPVALGNRRAPHFRERVVEHHHGVADLDIGMHEFAAWSGRAADLDRVEGALQKIDVTGTVRYSEVDGESGESRGDGLGCFGHIPAIIYRGGPGGN